MPENQYIDPPATWLEAADAVQVEALDEAFAIAYGGGKVNHQHLSRAMIRTLGPLAAAAALREFANRFASLPSDDDRRAFPDRFAKAEADRIEQELGQVRGTASSD